MRQRGDGSFYERDGKIYVCGSIDGKFYKKSTKINYTPANLKSLQSKGAINVLRDFLGKTEKLKNKNLDISKFSIMAINLGSDSRSKAVQKDYDFILKKYILSYFKDFALDEVLPMNVEKWQKTINHLSYERQKRIKGVLKLVFQKASKNRIIPYNPVSDSDRLVNLDEKKPTKIYTSNEISVILNESKKIGGWMYIWFLLSFTTGLRVGELLGLKWSDIDLDEGILSLKRSRNKNVEVGTSSRKNHERELVLLKEVVEDLRKFRSLSSAEYVFVSRTGKPWSESKDMIADYIKPFFEEIKIEYKQLKTTRSSFVTKMYRDGVDFSFLQDMIGHSLGSEITFKHYINKVYTIEEKRQKMLAAENSYMNTVGSTLK